MIWGCACCKSRCSSLKMWKLTSGHERWLGASLFKHIPQVISCNHQIRKLQGCVQNKACSCYFYIQLLYNVKWYSKLEKISINTPQSLQIFHFSHIPACSPGRPKSWQNKQWCPMQPWKATCHPIPAMFPTLKASQMQLLVENKK